MEEHANAPSEPTPLPRKKKDPDRKALIKHLTIAGVSAVLVLAIALLFYFLPFRELLPAYAIPARGEGEMRLHFIDVGEGDATLIEFPSGNCLLIDGGDGSLENTNHLIRYLGGLEMKSLSVVSSHADADHCGGLQSVIENFPVEKLYLPVLPSDTGSYLGMVAAAERRGVETETLTRYGCIGEEGAYAVCISPYSAGEEESNDSSAVLYVRGCGVNALLGADISSARERRLLGEWELDNEIFNSGNCEVDLRDVDILRVSHHGSASSSAAEWLQLIDPEVAVISCGRDNDYAHPAEETIARLTECGANILRLDEVGDVLITLHDGSYIAQTLNLE